jgi:hypothetical protein
MTEYTGNQAELPELLQRFWELLEASRPAFRQERTYQRAVAMVFGELFCFGRHTVTQVLRTLGETEKDWTPWYRLIGCDRFAEEEVGRGLLRETVLHVPEEAPYVSTADGVQMPRSGRKIAGSGWWLAPNTAPFQKGLHRAQRFVEITWLTPLEEGYSRAIPLRWLPAPTERSVASADQACKEWEAGLRLAAWVRKELDGVGREKQRLLVLGDGSYDVQGIWREKPERTDLMIRCAKNRNLHALPCKQEGGRGRRRLYGDKQRKPPEYLAEKSGWETVRLTIRGHERKLTYRQEGPFLVEGAPDQPLFLLVVRGETYWSGGRRKYRKPAYYLVSAIEERGRWRLPWPAETLLLWSWQRWECEVAHREMKSALGVGEKQCWGPSSAHSAVQWGVWVYALCVLAAYRTWGLLRGPTRVGAWYPRAHRWSFTSLWQAFRAELWQMSEFRPLYTPLLSKWLKNETWHTALGNAVADAGRI